MYRNSYVEIDLDALRHNIRFFTSGTDKILIGVVKADGYGMIDYIEAKTLKEEGVDHFAVSSLDEALHLREHGIDGSILILGQVPDDSMDLIKKNDLSIVTLSLPFVQKAQLNGVKVHLKLNTGMNRIGVRTAEAKQCLGLLKDKGAIIEGVMSHFSSADEDIEYSKAQYERFKKCVQSLDYDFPLIHMSATDGAIAVDDDICNAQRIGLGLLGLSAYKTDLKQVIGLYSHVSMLKKPEAGDTVSYGRHYTSDGNGWLLTIPLGYADGFYRSNTGKKVWCENEYGTIVGSICMDQLMILCEHPHEEGSKVELLGSHIDVAQRAKELGTIPYELYTSLSDRLTRKYLKNKKVFMSIDPRF
ncbi:MAG: alanine racemase [Erysipelotrichaceae bacterium]|nr:alanine racemase [Erysipelotrichaceae bacterium]